MTHNRGSAKPGKGGRPRLDKGLRKSHTVFARLADIDYSILQDKCREANMSESDYIRKAIEDSNVVAKAPATLIENLKPLFSIANNLNQIARRANTEGAAWLEAEIRTAIGEIRKFIAEVRSLWN